MLGYIVVVVERDKPNPGETKMSGIRANIFKVTISISAADLARAYFDGRLTGCVRAPEGMTSEGRPVTFIEISRGARRVTLSGKIHGHRWEQTYPTDAVRVDD